jgi:pyruvate kinase
MNLLWGVHPLRRARARTAEDMMRAAETELVRQGRVSAGDVLAVVAGTQMASGSTNFMRLHVVTTKPASTRASRGRLRPGKARDGES